MEDYSVLIVNHHLNKFDLLIVLIHYNNKLSNKNGFLSN